MVAINFSPEFSDLVASGKKKMTLRRKSRIKVGDKIQLYVGQRTKSCRKLLENDPTCIAVYNVVLNAFSVELDGSVLASPDVFAQKDGFPNYQEMLDWFEKKYGNKFSFPMEMTAIEWS